MERPESNFTVIQPASALMWSAAKKKKEEKKKKKKLELVPVIQCNMCVACV